MQPRTISISDIHGHSIALEALLESVDVQQRDTLVFLGDYIDRGPDSKGVIEQVIRLADRCHVVPLMGNHEEMLLSARADNRSFETWMSNGGDAALRSYGTTDDLNCIPQKHIDFFQGLLRGHETEDYFFFHANYAPNWRLEDHDSNTALWMSLNDIPGPHYSGKIAVLGHTPQPEGKILDLGHLICIDTGCGFGGLLTALDLTSRKIWQVDELGQEITAKNG